MKEIIVTIIDGEPVIETKGFAGKDCLKATAELEAALGGKTSDKPTAEMHRIAPTVKAVQR